MNAPQKKPQAAETVEDVLNEMDSRDDLPQPQGLALLRAPFPEHQISKLPKPTKKDAPKGKCKPKRDGGDAPDWQEHFCGGYHGLPAVHLDYVGHAALTDRLLDADPNWSWEPAGFTPEGLPALDRNGGLWIKLTVCGVTRFGYGCADGKSGGDAMKEIIGDALRNAAMRFGAALELWHKGELHADEEDKPENPGTGERKPRERVKYEGGPYTCPTQLMTAARQFVHTLNGIADYAEYLAWAKTPDVRDFIKQLKKEMPDWWYGGPDVPQDFVPLEILAGQKERDLQAIDEVKTREGVA